MSLWGVVESIGSIVGLLTGIFVIYDKLFKNVPVMYFDVLTFSSGYRSIILRIKNVSQRPILVKFARAKNRNTFSLGLGDGARDSIVSLISKGACVSIDGNSDYYLKVVNSFDFDLVKDDEILSAYVKWRFAQYSIHNIWRCKKLSIKKEDYKILLNKEAIDN
ncbi:hypothetical protein MWN33_15095 [Starkeya koreensis]|uniref:Uncharacterized protein n=1 Tax=Ancylobacter koreensis TaxID=266121 RepID=A0ABT0DQ21_9HYPH|nr:hypothetical protein [Ancylobacter koreensis]MCK0209360.1 hypothetical protein [Ancylobacter koreensis]